VRVMFGVVLGGLSGVRRGLGVVAVGDVRVMTRQLGFALLVVVGGFPMVVRGLGVVIGGHPMVVNSFF
jgi:hypothetical protein